MYVMAAFSCKCVGSSMSDVTEDVKLELQFCGGPIIQTNGISVVWFTQQPQPVGFQVHLK